MKNNKQDNKTVPELRFPKFENNGDWELKKLGTLARRVLEKNKDGSIESVFTNSATDGIVDQREYFDRDIANKSNLENYYVVKEGDYIYNPRISTHAPVGPTSKNKTNKTGVMSPLYTVFRFKAEDNDFYEYYFQSSHWYSSIRKASNTGARFDRMSIKASDFMKISVLFPSPLEQQKIAATLTSLDHLIAAENEKLQALQDHKKGLLQQLFPAKAEKVPKLRFREFSGEWEEKKLIDITHKKIKWSFTGGPFGSSLKSSDYVPEENGVRIIQLQNIGDGAFKNNYKIFTSKEKADELVSNNIYPGEIIMSKMGDPVGRACLIPNYHDRYVMASDGIRVVVNEEKHDKYFIYSLINSKLFRTKIENSSTGSTRKRIGLSVLKNLTFYVPNKNEQQKIANCLSFLDDLIAAQSEKIQSLKEHKKGLMQQMFPNV